MSTEHKWTDGKDEVITPMLIDDTDEDTIEEISLAIPQSQRGITAFKPVEEGFLTTIFPEGEEANLPRNMKHGFFADIPIICYGEAKYDADNDLVHDGCPYFEVCPLQDTPEDMTSFCAIEKWLIINLVRAYAQDLGVTANAAIDISEIKDIIRIDIQLSRIDKQTQIDPDDFVKQITSYDQQGNAATRFEEHPKHQLRERLLNRKHRLLRDVMGTRESMKSYINLTTYRKTASITAQERFKRKMMELEKQDKERTEDGTN